MSGYVKCFDEANFISFFIKDWKLLEAYNKIWKRVCNLKLFGIEPVYNEKYLEINIKSYGGNVKTNSHTSKMPEEGIYYICLSMISIDSVVKVDKNCYPLVFLEECKYIVKKN